MPWSRVTNSEHFFHTVSCTEVCVKLQGRELLLLFNASRSGIFLFGQLFSDKHGIAAANLQSGVVNVLASPPPSICPTPLYGGLIPWKPCTFMTCLTQTCKRGCYCSLAKTLRTHLLLAAATASLACFPPLLLPLLHSFSVTFLSSTPFPTFIISFCCLFVHVNACVLCTVVTNAHVLAWNTAFLLVESEDVPVTDFWIWKALSLGVTMICHISPLYVMGSLLPCECTREKEYRDLESIHLLSQSQVYSGAKLFATQQPTRKMPGWVAGWYWVPMRVIDS